MEPAQGAGLRDGMSLRQQNFRAGDAFCGDVAVDGGAGGLLEDLVQIGIAQIKLRCQYGDAEFFRQMLIDVVQYLVDLGVVAFGSAAQFILCETRLLGSPREERPVQKGHQL